MIRIFSCCLDQCVGLLWRNAWLGYLSIYLLDCFLAIELSSLYNLYISPLSDTWFENISFPSYAILSHPYISLAILFDPVILEHRWPHRRHISEENWLFSWSHQLWIARGRPSRGPSPSTKRFQLVYLVQEVTDAVNSYVKKPCHIWQISFHCSDPLPLSFSIFTSNLWWSPLSRVGRVCYHIQISSLDVSTLQ